MNLTADQNDALNKITNFLQSRDRQIFILKGYAGSGKTYLIKIIAEYLKKNHIDFYLAAPTGRAARVLASKSGMNATTIHKLIYSEKSNEIIENENAEIIWHFDVGQNDHSINAVYVFDEASMISDVESDDNENLRFGSGRLLHDIIEFVNLKLEEKSKQINRKIIFVGDPAQLPPVSENSSPALSGSYLNKEYGLKSVSHELKEVVRQVGNSHPLNAATSIRNSLYNNRYNSFNINNFVTPLPQKEGFFTNWSKIDDKKIICYSNKIAFEENLFIRKNLFGNEGNQILLGEELIVTSNNYYYGLMNGEFVSVVDAEENVENFERTLKGWDKPTHISFRNVKIKSINEKSEEIVQNVKITDHLLWSGERDLTKEEFILTRIIAEEKEGISYPRKKHFSNIKEYNAAKKEYFKRLRESPYFNALRVKFGYAVTCHKAQGGEWENVFINFSGFSAYSNEFFFRWAYTAVTRAKQELYAINLPHFTPYSNLLSNPDDMNELAEFEEVNIPEIEIPPHLRKKKKKRIYLK
ncbi:MAG: hypothetical protein D6830_07790, partial [Ignavibacteria bacterium]